MMTTIIFDPMILLQAPGVELNFLNKEIDIM